MRGRVARTFFDGVPDDKPVTAPAAPEKEKNPETPAVKPAPAPAKKFFHPPFQEQACDSCHDSKASQKLLYEGKELCFSCHDDFTKDKKSVHPPAEEGECLECHEPHQAEHERLLKKTVPNICYECHDDFTKNKKTVHYPVEEGACLECHEPHSAENDFVLKKPAPSLCFDCHDEKEIRGMPAHQGSQTCTDCHEVHSADKEKLLK